MLEELSFLIGGLQVPDRLDRPSFDDVLTFLVKRNDLPGQDRLTFLVVGADLSHRRD